MKTTLPTINRKTTSSTHILQACHREQARFDYQVAMDLIGAEFKRRRLEKGLSIADVAQALKMRKYRICLIEHGLYIHLDLTQLCRLSGHYGASWRDILSIIPDTLFDDIDY